MGTWLTAASNRRVPSRRGGTPPPVSVLWERAASRHPSAVELQGGGQACGAADGEEGTQPEREVGHSWELAAGLQGPSLTSAQLVSGQDTGSSCPVLPSNGEAHPALGPAGNVWLK